MKEWEEHAGWWQRGFTAGADPEYVEQIVPMAAADLRGCKAVLDVGCGEGQIARLAAYVGASQVVGLDPTWAQLSVAQQRGGPPAYCRPSGAGSPQ